MNEACSKPISRVGVIIPAHNRAASLPRALDSVLRQTWTDLEVLVVDDASTDGTAEVVRQCDDARVSLLRLDHQHGAGGARNRGIEQMQNPWIAFQDSDDEWLPDKLERQLEAADDGGDDTGFVFCRARRVLGDREYLFPPPHVKPMAGRLFTTMLAGNLVTTQTALVRRDLFSKWGVFDEHLPPLEDWEFFLRLSQHVDAVMMNEALVKAPFSADSISRNDQNYIDAFRGILDRYADALSRTPAIHARHLGTIADRYCMAGNWTEGRAWYRRAASLYPRHGGHAGGWILAHVPPAYRWVRRLRGR